MYIYVFNYIIFVLGWLRSSIMQCTNLPSLYTVCDLPVPGYLGTWLLGGRRDVVRSIPHHWTFPQPRRQQSKHQAVCSSAILPCQLEMNCGWVSIRTCNFLRSEVKLPTSLGSTALGWSRFWWGADIQKDRIKWINYEYQMCLVETGSIFLGTNSKSAWWDSTIWYNLMNPVWIFGKPVLSHWHYKDSYYLQLRKNFRYSRSLPLCSRTLYGLHRQLISPKVTCPDISWSD